MVTQLTLSVYLKDLMCIISKVMNDLLMVSDNGISVLILPDCSAAFDTDDHYILLQRLEHTVYTEGIRLAI